MGTLGDFATLEGWEAEPVFSRLEPQPNFASDDVLDFLPEFSHLPSAHCLSSPGDTGALLTRGGSAATSGALTQSLLACQESDWSSGELSSTDDQSASASDDGESGMEAAMGSAAAALGFPEMYVPGGHSEAALPLRSQPLPTPPCPFCCNKTTEECNRNYRTKHARSSNKLAKWYSKFGYDGPVYCKACSERFAAHLLRQKRPTPRFGEPCSRERPCLSCAAILQFYDSPPEAVFAMVERSRAARRASRMMNTDPGTHHSPAPVKRKKQDNIKEEYAALSARRRRRNTTQAAVSAVGMIVACLAAVTLITCSAGTESFCLLRYGKSWDEPRGGTRGNASWPHWPGPIQRNPCAIVQPWSILAPMHLRNDTVAPFNLSNGSLPLAGGGIQDAETDGDERHPTTPTTPTTPVLPHGFPNWLRQFWDPKLNIFNVYGAKPLTQLEENILVSNILVQMAPEFNSSCAHPLSLCVGLRGCAFGSLGSGGVGTETEMCEPLGGPLPYGRERDAALKRCSLCSWEAFDYVGNFGSWINALFAKSGFSCINGSSVNGTAPWAPPL